MNYPPSASARLPSSRSSARASARPDTASGIDDLSTVSLERYTLEQLREYFGRNGRIRKPWSRYKKAELIAYIQSEYGLDDNGRPLQAQDEERVIENALQSVMAPAAVVPAVAMVPSASARLPSSRKIGRAHV